MRIYIEENGKTPWEQGLRLSKTAVALGGFDAMHIGHKAIIRDVIETAKQRNLQSVVYFFCNQPKEVLQKTALPYVNTLETRLSILEEMGVEVAVAQRFTSDFLQVMPEEFVQKYLKEYLGAAHVAAGFNYRFGFQGKGDMKRLARLAEPLQMTVSAVPCVKCDGHSVSSTRIRELIQSGRMEEANACLGRVFFVKGTVIGGNRIGRTLGFPTANMEIPQNLLIPKYGVYCTEAKLDDGWHAAITNVGGRPTVEEGRLCIETHLLDYHGDLYGRELTVRFHHRLREIKRFGSLEELKSRLEKDQAAARAYFQQRTKMIEQRIK